MAEEKAKTDIAAWIGIVNCAVSLFYSISLACAMSDGGTKRWKEIVDNGGAIPYIGFILNIMVGVASLALFIIAIDLVEQSDNSVLRRSARNISLLLIWLSGLTIMLKIIALCVNAEYLFWGALLLALGVVNIALLINVTQKQ